MPSKSKEVRMEQRRILEKKLDLRLQQLAQKGISTEKKAQSDPLVKKLKAKIRETNVRIAVFDKNVAKIQELLTAREQKLAAKTAPKVEQVLEAAPAESKPKKKSVTGDKETKKKATPPAEGEAPKKPRKKKEEAKEE
jgi:hypothetical protein